MAKHLTPTDVDAIVAIIRGWSTGKLSWNGVCDSAAAILGSKTTRQTLSSHQPIMDAFSAKKSGAQVHEPRTSTPSSLAIAAQRLAHQQNVIDELKTTNAALLERFAQWQYNAHKYGVKEHQLNESLPRIDRERTDA